jgi:hypothetical protein
MRSRVVDLTSVSAAAGLNGFALVGSHVIISLHNIFGEPALLNAYHFSLHILCAIQGLKRCRVVVNISFFASILMLRIMVC